MITTNSKFIPIGYGGLELAVETDEHRKELRITEWLADDPEDIAITVSLCYIDDIKALYQFIKENFSVE